MAADPADVVLDRVGERLRSLSPTPSQFSVFRVPNQLRKINETAYEQEMLAIGPYHRGKDHLMAFEAHRTRYLQNLLHRRGLNRCLSDYVMTTRALEEKARKCYGGSISLDKEEFVEMMLLDGCFVVEVIRKNLRQELKEDNDPIFKLGWMMPFIARDKFLVENQRPFFVLWELLSMTEGKAIQELMYIYPTEEIKHLLGFVHKNWLPWPAGIDAFKISASKNSDWRFICCATEIQEAGIKFQKVEDSFLFDLKFENGVMKIPTLAIGDTTEAVLSTNAIESSYAIGV